MKKRPPHGILRLRLLKRFEIEYYPSEMVFSGPAGQGVSVHPREGAEAELAWDGTRVKFERVMFARRITEIGAT